MKLSGKKISELDQGFKAFNEHVVPHLKSAFDAYTVAGFTESQAMQLVTYMSVSFTARLIDGEPTKGLDDFPT